jgi:hypothetical protein
MNDSDCKTCLVPKYGYTDGTHSIYLCFKCGKYEGISGGDDSFVNNINENPMLLLHMIKSKMLVPIS